jgi:Protein of unknown function (DUF4058)
MKSPFPGMDPFLEQPAYWPDFHFTFINYWREAVADALPAHYEATLGERVYLVEHDPELRKLGFPDIAVTHDAPSAPAPGASSGGTATLEPVTIPLAILEGPRETYIEILYQPDHSLVATLELLSPANKEQPGRTEYLAKRRALLFQQVHLVELDLLLGGHRLPLERPLPAADYYYLVSRADRRPDCEVHRWTLPTPLPTLPIPLRAPDQDILVDLGAVFATAYARGRFFRRVNHAGSMPAVLGKRNQGWVEDVLKHEAAQ